MPICDTTPSNLQITSTLTDINQNASELAKIKRVKEQAYFNSYDFDAIEVIPSLTSSSPTISSEASTSENDINFNNEKLNSTTIKSQNVKEIISTNDINEKFNSDSTGINSLSISTTTRTHGYFVRLKSLLSSANIAKNIKASSIKRQIKDDDAVPTDYNLNGSLQIISNDNSCGSIISKRSSQSKTSLCKSDFRNPNNDNSVHDSSVLSSNKIKHVAGGLILPRAILKYQNIENSVNSMPSSSSSVTSISAKNKKSCNIDPITSLYTTTELNKTDITQSKHYHDQLVQEKTQILQQLQLYSLDSKNLSSLDNVNLMNQAVPTLSKTFVTSAAVHTNSDIDSTNTIIDNVNNKSQKYIKKLSSDIKNVDNNRSNEIKNCEYYNTTPKENKSSEILKLSPFTKNEEKQIPLSQGALVATESEAFTKTFASKMLRQSSQNYSEKSCDRSSIDQINNLSHYSTERSNGGSSGYYSTNLCSTSSIEEHIYSEPVIDNIVAEERIQRKFSDTNNSTTSSITHNSSNVGRRMATTSQKLRKIPKVLMMNKGDMATAKDNFYMTNRSFNETFVGSARKFFNNSSLKRSKYLHQLYDRQQQQGHHHSVYNDDICPEITVNYNFSSINNSHHGLQNASGGNSNQINNIEDDLKNTKMNESLKNLEMSIENLDRHLKNYSHLKNSAMLLSSTYGSPILSCDQNAIEEPSDFISKNGELTQKVPSQMNNVYLPTIMEGIDSQSSHTKRNQQKSWTDDILDDSLMDIDLDSFLLVNENNQNSSTVVGQTKSFIKNNKDNLEGIDNPTFDTNEILIREPMENNYKCSKYINSCPENAYKVESELEHNLPPMIGNASLSNDKTIAFFLKKYEDQIHFQNTRDMLEDIQIKIRNIAEIAGEDDRVIPKVMENNINQLKIQLEEYLSIMNHNSELEIKQFCTSVVNNQKLVTLTKAFERRKSLTTNSASGCNSEFDYDVNYESVPKRLCCSIENTNNSNSAMIVSNRNQLIYDGGSIVRPQGQSKKIHDENSLYGDSNGRHISINDKLSFNDLYRLENGEFDKSRMMDKRTSQMQKNLSYNSPFLDREDLQKENEDKNSILEWHRNKPSSWELYYGTNRIHHTVKEYTGKHSQALMSYPSSRPESDFTLDLPRAEQLRLKMDKEKKFRQRCRILTTFLSLVFFLLTVMVVSLVLTRGKRMFGSML